MFTNNYVENLNISFTIYNLVMVPTTLQLVLNESLFVEYGVKYECVKNHA